MASHPARSRAHTDLLPAQGKVTRLGAGGHDGETCGVRCDRRLVTNDFLDFALLRHACRHRCTRFDFGRNKRGTGAFDFKRHWGGSCPMRGSVATICWRAGRCRGCARRGCMGGRLWWGWHRYGRCGGLPGPVCGCGSGWPTSARSIRGSTTSTSAPAARSCHQPGDVDMLAVARGYPVVVEDPHLAPSCLRVANRGAIRRTVASREKGRIAAGAEKAAEGLWGYRRAAGNPLFPAWPGPTLVS